MCIECGRVKHRSRYPFLWAHVRSNAWSYVRSQLDVRPIACSCKKSYDKVITQAILSHPRTTLSCSRAPAAYWRKTVRKILCVYFVHRSLSDASDHTCSVRPYFYLRLFLRVHSDQIEFCVSYDFLIASSRAPIVKAPLHCTTAQSVKPSRHAGRLRGGTVKIRPPLTKICSRIVRWKSTGSALKLKLNTWAERSVKMRKIQKHYST